MRKLVLLLVLMPFLAFGQQNFSLIKNGGIWRVTTISPPDLPLFPGSIIKEQFLMEGDTSFNNTIYKKVYLCDYSPSIYNKTFYGGIREDSLKRVYFFLDSNQYFNSLPNNIILQYRQEYLLYDFSLKKGDTLRVVNSQDSILILNKIDSIIVANQYHKRWEFFSVFNGMTNVWVEGIGDLNGLFFSLQSDGVETFHNLACYEDSNMFWTNPNLQGIDCFSVGFEENIQERYKVTVNPNPTSGKLNIELIEVPKETIVVELYDITGRLIRINEFFNQTYFSLDISDLQNGIYLLKIKSDKEFSKSIKIIKN